MYVLLSTTRSRSSPSTHTLHPRGILTIGIGPFQIVSPIAHVQQLRYSAAPLSRAGVGWANDIRYP